MSSVGHGAVVMHGKVVRDALMSRLRDALVAAGSPTVTLATVLVGDDAPSRTYVRNKHAAAASVGIASVGVELPADTDGARLADEVRRLAEDRTVHGILVQMPLPGHLDPDEVLALIPPEKDVDGLTTASLGRLVRGQHGHVGCTPLGVMRLLEHYRIATDGARAVVVGRSTLVGVPMSLLLARRGVDATVTLAHSRTADLVALCREADIIVSATGVARCNRDRRGHLAHGVRDRG
jgi:methylenetetrahydrofolate dehydrogenase (NADP+)/methenyltetrahydrofolate cyclohydrolase